MKPSAQTQVPPPKKTKNWRIKNISEKSIPNKEIRKTKREVKESGRLNRAQEKKKGEKRCLDLMPTNFLEIMNKFMCRTTIVKL
jgi:hypothetical protein